MEAKPYSTGKNKMWLLPATPATTQWGVFDNTVTPALRINSGDTVAIETLRAGNGQVVPGISIEQLITINTALPGRGPHTVTGPIYVNGAEPGDVVAVHINKIRMLSNATNNSSPTGGLFPEIFPSRVDSYYLDNDKMEAKFTKNIVIPLAPFPGILAVGRPDADSTGRLCTVQTVAPGSAPNSCNTVPPGDYGGNLDLKEMQVGSTTYLPVFVPGALIWTGDSHAAQGNGEFDLDALETAFPELNVTITLIKNQPQVTWPIVENPTTYTACPISEVVDIVLGTYCVIPKDRNAPAANPLPRKDNSDFWVTHASNADPMVALKAAVMASIKKISSKLHITADRSYRLSTFVTDCQFGPYRSGPYDITCLVPKSIYRG
ncbi:MAG: acetamidase/formamidase family protein [Actinobacteria bacterium]|nr:acetamidase/formamidase family protein [Actinomycetota bacterium]